MSTDRIFEPVKIRFLHAGECDEFDRFSGKTTPRSESKNTHVEMLCELEFRGLAQKFEVVGIIAIKGYNIGQLQKQMQAAIIKGVRNREVLSFYRRLEIGIKEDDASFDATEAVSEIDDYTAGILEQQAIRSKQAEEAFEQTKQKFKDLMSKGYSWQKSEIRRAFGDFQGYHHNAIYGMNHAWAGEKLASIRRYLDNLDSWKNPYRAEYEAAENSIISLLTHWPAPERWRTAP